MWWPLIVPIGVAIALFFTCREKFAWWEPLVLFIPTILVCLIFALTTGNLQTRDKEWCTQKCSRIEYHEKYVREWEEYVPPTYDEDGNQTGGGYWETHTEHHAPHWDKIGENGKSYRMTKKKYELIKRQWLANGQKEVYKDLHHSDQRHKWGCPKGQKCNCSDGRGDMFYIQWPASHHTIQTITWTQTWHNRVKATKETVFRFPEVSEERAAELYQLPSPNKDWETNCILGNGGPTQGEANQELLRQNALVGPRSANDYEKACRMWVLIFNESVRDVDARDQEALWKGGNKNEFILCIGVDKEYKPDWSYVISWTNNNKVKIDVRDYVMDEYSGKPIDLVDVVGYMSKRCTEDFTRKTEAEWSYLSVVPPMWAIVVCWAVTLLVNGGVTAFVILNDFTHDDPTGKNAHRRHYGLRRFRRFRRYR
jgi:hypothetical protein